MLGFVGMAYVLYGRKQDALVPLVSGILLMIVPYFLPGVLPQLIVVLIGLPFLLRGIRSVFLIRIVFNLGQHEVYLEFFLEKIKHELGQLIFVFFPAQKCAFRRIVVVKLQFALHFLHPGPVQVLGHPDYPVFHIGDELGPVLADILGMGMDFGRSRRSTRCLGRICSRLWRRGCCWLC